MNKKFLKDMLRQKRRWIALLVLTAGITGIQIILPWIATILIDKCIPNSDLKNAILLMIAAAIIIMVNCILKKVKIETTADASILFQQTCRNAIFSQYQSMPYHKLHAIKFGDKSSNVIQDVENLSALLFEKIANSASDFIFMVCSFLVLLMVSPLLTMVLYSAVAIVIIVIYLLKKTMMRHYKEMVLSRSQLNSTIHEVLSAQKVIAVNQIEDSCMERIKKQGHKLLIETLKSNIFGPSIQSSVEMATMVTYLITFILYEKSGITLGRIFLFLSYLPQMWGKFSTMMDIFNDMVAAGVLIDRIYCLNSEKNVSFIMKEDHNQQISKIDCIEMKDADFSFEAKETAILDKFNVKITLPGIYYITGPSGIGKSTLFDIFLGFYQLKAGQLLYNGENIDCLNLSAVRQQIRLIPQEDYLFEGTILENITLGRQIKEADIIRLIHDLGADHYFKHLPQGLLTWISDDEVLSSGEKKVLSLLRACCDSPSVLLFDEVTSNLDNKSAGDMENMIHSLSKKYICICITHKSHLPLIRGMCNDNTKLSFFCKKEMA